MFKISDVTQQWLAIDAIAMALVVAFIVVAESFLGRRWRFGLRTILVGTMLVAIILTMAVYAVKK